jgi:S1-C subfamily serine protease
MKARVRSIICLPLLLSAALAAQVATPSAQSTPATVILSVRAALVDKDLNVKPVPKLNLLLQSDADSSRVAFSTNLEGRAEVRIAPGTYKLSTPQELEFKGNRYSWAVPVKVETAGSTIELSDDNAKISAFMTAPVRKTDELTDLFRRYQGSVVTVWSEFGHGTGFIVDPAGLILTNQHVIGPSEYIAVQFDEQTKIPAVLLSADAERDVAVLWANISQIQPFVVAPLAKPNSDPNRRITAECLCHQRRRRHNIARRGHSIHHFVSKRRGNLCGFHWKRARSSLSEIKTGKAHGAVGDGRTQRLDFRN